MATPLQSPYAQFFDANGDPLSGGKVYTYSAGTTTPKATYTDAGGLTPAANPIVLDSAGRAAIWIVGSYRIDVYTSADVLVRSTDNVPAFTAGGDMTKAVYDPANIAQQLVGTTAVQSMTNKTVNGVVLTATGSSSNYLNEAGAYTTLTSQFTLSFTSSDQTITSAGTLTLAHGLGVAPKFITCELICQSSDGGYTAGQVIPVPNNVYTNGTTFSGVAFVIDSTNITLRFSSSAQAFSVINFSSGSVANLTNSNFKLRVKAWA